MSEGNGDNPIKKKGTKERNWPQLFEEWLSGQDADLKVFAKRMDVPHSAVMKKSATDHWIQKRRDLEGETISRVAELNAKKIAEARIRHLNIALKLQKKGLANLKRLPVLAAPEALRAVTQGVLMERAALGMDDSGVEGKGASSDNRIQAVINVFNGSSNARQEKFIGALRQLFGTRTKKDSGESSS